MVESRPSELFKDLSNALANRGLTFQKDQTHSQFVIPIPENINKLVAGTASENSPNVNAKRFAAKLGLFGTVMQQAVSSPKAYQLSDGFHESKNKAQVVDRSGTGLQDKIGSIKGVDAVTAANLGRIRQDNLVKNRLADLNALVPTTWVVQIKDFHVVDAKEPPGAADRLLSIVRDGLSDHNVSSYLRGGRLVIPVIPNLPKILAGEHPKGLSIRGLSNDEIKKHAVAASQSIATLVESVSHKNESRQLTLKLGKLHMEQPGVPSRDHLSWIVESHERPTGTLE